MSAGPTDPGALWTSTPPGLDPSSLTEQLQVTATPDFDVFQAPRHLNLAASAGMSYFGAVSLGEVWL